MTTEDVMGIFARRRRDQPGPADPDDQFRLMIGTALGRLQHGDVARARQWLAQASRTTDPRMLTDLGGIYQALGDLGQAEACLRRAAEGGSADAMNALGVLLKNDGRLDDA